LSSRRMVSFMPRPLYLWENSPSYTLDRSRGGLQRLCGRYGEDLPLPGIETGL
jgi:hypothetical protein